MNYRIGLVGKMGSGKSAVKDILVSKYGFRSVAFGDRLKQAASLIWEIPIQQFYSGIGKNQVVLAGKTGRKVLQELGDKIREINWNSWNIAVDGFIKLNPDSDIVIDDVRFKTEALFIRDANKILLSDRCIWKIVRPVEIYSKVDEKKHISETEQDGIEADVIINNDGTLKDLETKVEETLNKIKRSWLDRESI